MNFISINNGSQVWATLPALLQIALFFAAWVLLWLPLALVVLLAIRQAPKFPVPAEQKFPLLISLYLVAPGLLWGIAHGLGHTDLAAYGWDWGAPLIRGIGQGALLGIVGVAILTAIQLLARWRLPQPSGHGWLTKGGIALGLGGLTLAISAIEELVFRGFIVNQLQGDFSLIGVLLISSVIFALLHLVWDGPAGVPQLPGLVMMGAVLWLGRWAQGGLIGIPCGLHWGWIWSLAVLDTLGVMGPNPKAPNWLVGRPDQPLTSPLVLALMAVTALVLVAWPPLGTAPLVGAAAMAPPVP